MKVEGKFGEPEQEELVPLIPLGSGCCFPNDGVVA